MADVRKLLPLLTEDQARCIDHALLFEEGALSAGLLLATKSGAWLERKASESAQSASTLAEIQLAVALQADRMEAVTALLRAAETRAQLALMSRAAARHEYGQAKARFTKDTDPAVTGKAAPSDARTSFGA